MKNIASEWGAVCRRIRQAEALYNREAGSVQLLAVSKTQSASSLAALAELGQRAFGENYLQEALTKQQQLSQPMLEWHYIGPVQSNKCRQIAEHFAWIHSVSRLKEAQLLSQFRPDGLPPLQLLLQVNISQETTKSGVSLDALPELASRVAELPRVALRGLMALPAPETELARSRAQFARLAQAQAELQAAGLALDQLSMGMSADLEAAIAEGATWVRVGSALFGARPSSKSKT